MVSWSILLKINSNSKFLKDDRFSSGNVNMTKVYERLLSTNILREKRRNSFDPQRVILLGEDIICMVNLLEILRVIVFFITSLTCFGCFRREVLFCQASMKIKMSPPSVHC